MKDITLFEFDKDNGYISIFAFWNRYWDSRCLFYFQWKDRVYLDLLFIHVIR